MGNERGVGNEKDVWNEMIVGNVESGGLTVEDLGSDRKPVAYVRRIHSITKRIEMEIVMRDVKEIERTRKS